MNSYANLEGKVVMVTGASSGLGEALAREFARGGCNVYIAARREEKLVALAQELELTMQTDQRAIPIKLDVTDNTQVVQAAHRMIKDYGRIDIWINNAGSEKPASVLDLSREQLQEITAVNYFGLVYGTKAAAQQMVQQGYGDIVQILSTSAFTPRANEAAYCAAKAAAEMYSRCAQKELQEHGIRVIPVKPGGMETNFAQNAGLQMPKDAMSPEDVAELIVHAVSLPRNIAPDLTLFRNG
ncbi:MAG TPA: SDR family oxidoreductase [Candidatus Nanoarchaeia archaeon]|nr:SDR family oxidoreductase [Candidatus Nanoarchaeia archaeon]